MNEDEILIKAYLKSCEFLELNTDELNILKNEELKNMNMEEKTKVKVVAIINIYKNLTTLINDEQSRKIWLNSYNKYFNEKPIKVLYSGNIMKVDNYLENNINY